MKSPLAQWWSQSSLLMLRLLGAPFGSSRLQDRLSGLAYFSNPMTQCKSCFSFGHPTQCCKSDHPVCPICSLSHRRSAHRYPYPIRPKQGNAKAVPACCPASPLKCTNCQAEHLATDLYTPAGHSPHKNRRWTLPRARAPQGTGWMSLRMMRLPHPALRKAECPPSILKHPAPYCAGRK